MPLACSGHSDYTASASKILLIFKYQTTDRKKARNTKAGLQAIAAAQLDAHLWRRRKRRRKTAKRKSSWRPRKLDTEPLLKGTAAIGKRSSWNEPWAGNLKTTWNFKSWFNQASTKELSTGMSQQALLICVSQDLLLSWLTLLTEMLRENSIYFNDLFFYFRLQNKNDAKSTIKIPFFSPLGLLNSILALQFLRMCTAKRDTHL